jgi:hypothetical protein
MCTSEPIRSRSFPVKMESQPSRNRVMSDRFGEAEEPFRAAAVGRVEPLADATNVQPATESSRPSPLSDMAPESCRSDWA